jgi:Ca-activated chloride channel homolog
MRHPHWTAVALAAVLAAPAGAQGWIEIERPRPTLPIGGPVVRVRSDVRATIEGRVARVEVEEYFQNAGGSVAEGSYLYPLPGEAVFNGFSLWMGDRELRGEMMNADQARGIYESIVRRLKDPALLTLAGHGLIRAQVFPIQPGETRKVVLRYTQVLERSGDALRMRYSIGPRAPRRAMGDEGPPSGSFSFRATLQDADAIGTPYSPTHDIDSRRDGQRLVVSLPEAASGDVELFLPLRRGLVGTSVLTHAPGGEDGFYMLLVSPPASETETSVPRDLTLVVDVSGSMSGTKLEQAKAGLLQALGAMRPADRFRLIAFSSTVRHFRDGFTPATGSNLAAARSFVDGLGAEGGTNIAGALDAALDATPDPERLSLVVFMTDGLPSVGEQRPDRIAAQAAGQIGRRRIFTVGVGHDVNTFLLDRLAKEGRGSASYVAPGASVEVAVGSLLQKIRHPALVNLRIVDAPVRLLDRQPADLPDLFYGEELVLFGRYRGTGVGDIVLEGERQGHRERFTARADFATVEHSNGFIPPLWASRKIGELTRTARLEGATPALVEEIRDLGLRYGILTEYTSYLVVEPGAAEGPVAMDRLDQAARGGVSAAREMSGSTAFQRAEASSKMAQATSLSAADEAAEERMANAAPSAPGSRAVESKRAGGRVFVLRGGVWTDIAHKTAQRIVTVAPYSDAYFALVRAMPELAPCLGVGDAVVLSGRRVSVKIATGGITTWQPGALETTVRDFRGR